MDDTLYRFNSLNTLIEEVHDLFDRWAHTEPSSSEIDLRVLHLVKLAVHEWMANLIQHATFNSTTPCVHLRIRVEPGGAACMIADNSQGFDLKTRLEQAPDAIQAFPERGTGLLIIQSSTEDLSYERTSDGYNRLSFCVSADRDTWLSIQY